ncbi:hypothetical protein TSUD_208400 [Trifolium subterraneum]|uniref:Uncharacterized protein n=1 Tax=Trifolium subterraneum TaxID=3900 RepID=A0A2Z6P4W2_TRISU|nr:hypothetical protein TSUD_208400 [Trifolium subterraneum]
MEEPKPLVVGSSNYHDNQFSYSGDNSGQYFTMNYYDDDIFHSLDASLSIEPTPNMQLQLQDIDFDDVNEGFLGWNEMFLNLNADADIDFDTFFDSEKEYLCCTDIEIKKEVVEEMGKKEGPLGDKELRNAIEMLEKEKKLVEEMPDMELEHRTKRLRQACFKANYKKRKLMEQEEKLVVLRQYMDNCTVVQSFCNFCAVN